MAIPGKITEFLKRKGVTFEAISHGETLSSVEEARALGIEADEVAKVIVVHHATGRALFALPANRRVDMKAVRQALEDRHARFANEEEMARDLPDFALGSVPPFGELADAVPFVDHHLAGHDTVVFAAGTHTDSIRIRVADVLALARNNLVEVCQTSD